MTVNQMIEQMEELQAKGLGETPVKIIGPTPDQEAFDATDICGIMEVIPKNDVKNNYILLMDEFGTKELIKNGGYSDRR